MEEKIKEEGYDCKNKYYKKVPLQKAKDISSTAFGKLTPLFRVQSSRTTWLCRCDCGNIIKVQANHLCDKTISSCGCCENKTRKFKDLSGQVFGALTCIERLYDDKINEYVWSCHCSCGKIIKVRTDNLLSGNTKSCGCLKTKIEDLTGHRYGFWQVLSQAKREEHHIFWNCLCICGTLKKVRGDELKSGRSLSCGCKTSSKGADKIEEIFNAKQIDYKKEYCIKGLISPKGKSLRFDFAVFYNNKLTYLVEYDGEQHFRPNEYFGGESELNYRKQCDEIKNVYCKEHHIPLIRIKYSELHLCNENTIFSSFFIS